jgi:hypothetical protein
MTNFAELKARRDAERSVKAAAKPKTEQKSATAAEIRSRHATMGRKYTTEEIRTLRKAMKLDLNQQQLQRLEEEQKRLDDLTEGDAQQEQRSDVPMFGKAPTPMPIPVPQGRDRDCYLAEQREADLDRRVALEELTAGLDLDPASARIFRLLLAHSQVRGKNQGEPGWRYVDLAAIGADPWAILGVDRPDEPVAGWNLITTKKPQPTAVERLEANRILAQGVERLRDLGLVRDAGLFVEVAIG